MSITAAEWEVLGFFEVEPETLDKDEAWPYNDFLYEVERGDVQLSCAIAPAYRDVRIILRVLGGTVYELNAVGVDDIRYREESKSEFLDLILSPTETITLRVNPGVELQHKVAEETTVR